jgi:fructuronate reductase
MVTPVTETRARLSAATLARARADVRPGYDRTGEPTIVHLGVGNFVRAHLALYADDLLQLGRAALIRGVSLHNPQVEAQLAPQDCYYTVAEQEPDAEPSLRVVGSIAAVSTGREAALRALCATATRLVTLTITEKGYDLTEEDLEHPERPTTAVGVVALALARCRDEGGSPPVISSLDNVMANGTLLRARVTEIVSRLDPSLPAWIQQEVRFPSSVVDRMVPATTEEDLEEISARLGLVDLGAVTTEHHRSWVMTNEPGLPPLGEVGVELVENIVPFEQRKLWLLNGPHSALAYCGILAGCTTIAAAANHPTVSVFVQRLVDDILQVADLPTELRQRAFAADALRRFKNPNLGHTCAKVAADGSRKLPQRFGSIVTARARAGLDTARFATVVALWIAEASGLRVRGTDLSPVEDPENHELRSAATTSDLSHVAHLALVGLFDAAFVSEVARTLERLLREGIELIEEGA